MIKKYFYAFFVIVSFLLIGCETDVQNPVQEVDDTNNGFEKFAVAETFAQNCATSGCHAGSSSPNSLSIKNHSDLMKGYSLSNQSPKGIASGNVGGEVVIPFNSEKSLLHKMIKGEVSPSAPHESISLSDDEINIIKNWIDDGAKNYQNVVPFSNPNYRVYVCNQGADFISVVDGDSKVVSRLLSVNETQNLEAPHMVKEFGDHYYISLIGAGKLLKVSKSYNQIVGEVSGIEKAGMIQITPDGNKAFVSRSSTSASIYNTVFSVDINSMTILSEILMPVTGVPHGIALTPDGNTLYVANLTKDRVSIIDVQNNLFVEDITLPQGTEPMQAAVSPDGMYLYISARGTAKLLVLDTQTKNIVSEVDLNMGPMHIAVSSDGNKIYIPSMMANVVQVIEKNGTNWTKISEISHPAMSRLHGCDLTADDKYLFVSSRNLTGDYQPYFKVNDEGDIGNLVIINTQTEEVIKVINLEESPTGLVVEK